MRTDGLTDIVHKIDEMFTFASLVLASEIGEDVDVVLPKSIRNQSARIDAFKRSIVEGRPVNGVLRIPNTAGDITTSIDLRAQQLTAAVEVSAPEDLTARAAISWLVKQLGESGDDVIVESYIKNARTPTAASLGAVRLDRSQLYDSSKVPASRFVLKKKSRMPVHRKSQRRKAGFVDGYMHMLADFYEDVVQGITPWQPPTPKRKSQEPERVADAIQFDRSWSPWEPYRQL